MARLPARPANRQLDSGAKFLRPFSSNTQTGRALSRFGSTIANAGIQAFNEETREFVADKREHESFEAKARGLAARQERITIENDLIDYENSLQKDLTERGENMKPDAAGFHDEFASASEKRANEILKKYRGNEKFEAYQTKFRKIRERYLDNAARAELKQRNSFNGDVADKKLKGLVGTVSINPGSFKEALTEYNDFVKGLNLGDRGTNILSKDGARALERAFVVAQAQRDPKGFLNKLGPNFQGQASAAALNPKDKKSGVAKTIIEKANELGFDPRLALGIANLESGLNPKTRPIRNGKALSSARGIFQIIDSEKRRLGVTNREDVAESAEKVIPYLMQLQRRAASLGHKPTAGKVYALYNLGGAAGPALLKAHPSTPIETVFRRVWSASFVAKVFAGNPSLYRRGMRTDQVIANFESKMAHFMKGTEKYVVGGSSDASVIKDDGAALKRELLGQDAQGLQLSDLTDIHAKLKKGLGKFTREQVTIAQGNSFLTGEADFDPYDTSDKRALNAAIANRGIGQAIAAGDANGYTEALSLTKRLKYVPEEVANTIRTTITTGADEDATIRAYQFLSEVERAGPTVFDASKITEEMKKRSAEYRVYTEQLGLNPSDAVKRIKANRSPEAELRRKELKKEMKSMLARRNWSEIQSELDTSNWTDPDAPPAVQASLTTLYQKAFQFHLEQGAPDEETAKGLAIADIKSSYGVTAAFTENGEASSGQRVMMLPPEKVLPEVKGNHLWAGEFSKELVIDDVTTKRGLESFKDKPDISLDNVFIIPRAETAQDHRRNRAGQGDGTVRYAVAYRDDNGRLQQVPGLHKFDARRKVEELIQSGDLKTREQKIAEFEANAREAREEIDARKGNAEGTFQFQLDRSGPL